MSEQDGEAQVRKVLADFAPDVLDLPADEDLIVLYQALGRGWETPAGSDPT